MKILFAAPEGAWDGFLSRLRRLLPEHDALLAQVRVGEAGLFDLSPDDLAA